MQKRITVGIFCFLLFALAAAAQEERGPSTPEEREQAVKLTKFLEQFPLHDDAQQATRWLLVFFIQVPDISVKACTSFLPDIGKQERKKKQLAGLFVQMIFSQGAFIIENPDKADDDHAVFLGGLEGTLKSYEAIIKQNPKSKHKKLNKLIQLREQGKLGEYVKKTMKKCG